MAKRIVYRLEVELSYPLSDDPNDADYPTLEGASSPSYKRGIEKSVIACLRKMEQECTNCEVLDFSVEEDA